MTMAFLIIREAMMSSDIGMCNITSLALTCKLLCSCPLYTCKGVLPNSASITTSEKIPYIYLYAGQPTRHTKYAPQNVMQSLLPSALGPYAASFPIFSLPSAASSSRGLPWALAPLALGADWRSNDV